MGRFFSYYVIIFLSILIVGCNKSSSFEPGALSPDFEFAYLNTTSKGEIHTLGELKGKRVLLIFWSTWCESCKSELLDLNKLQKSAPSDFQVLGIIIRDQKDKAAEFLQDNTIEFPVGIADTKLILDKYKGYGVPESFIISKDGAFEGFNDIDGEVKVRIIGARPWSQPEISSRLYDTRDSSYRPTPNQ